MIKKVISGGQTGVDRIGLEVAKELGIPTGGTAPKGYRTEYGQDPTLKKFGLEEDDSSGYTNRTALNVANSDATVLFGDMHSAGSRQTIAMLTQYRKLYRVNPTINELRDFIAQYDIRILNVAGNRGSKLSDAQKIHITNVLRMGLKY